MRAPLFPIIHPHPTRGRGGGRICSRCGQLNIYVPNPCKMMKWNTFTLNQPPPEHTLCHTVPSTTQASSTSLATLFSISLVCHSRSWCPRVLASRRCSILSPIQPPPPPPSHPKVSFPSLLEMAQVNTFCFFSLAILRVLGPAPKAENNYPLSIIGALWEV